MSPSHLAERRPVTLPPGAWGDAPLAALDFESTGVDPLSDRVISYGLVGHDDAEASGLVAPGVPVPPQSTEVHGIGDLDLLGAPPSAEVVTMLVAWVQDVVDAGAGLVVYNAPYDLTMLRAEAERWGVRQPDWHRLLVVDPMVVQWSMEPAGGGTHKLTDLCEAYDVAIDHAHDALCDARAARDLARALAHAHPLVGGADLAHVAGRQRRWFAERVAWWNGHALERGRPLEPSTGWPLS